MFQLIRQIQRMWKHRSKLITTRKITWWNWFLIEKIFKTSKIFSSFVLGRTVLVWSNESGLSWLIDDEFNRGNSWRRRNDWWYQHNRFVDKCLTLTNEEKSLIFDSIFISKFWTSSIWLKEKNNKQRHFSSSKHLFYLWSTLFRSRFSRNKSSMFINWSTSMNLLMDSKTKIRFTDVNQSISRLWSATVTQLTDISQSKQSIIFSSLLFSLLLVLSFNRDNQLTRSNMWIQYD